MVGERGPGLVSCALSIALLCVLGALGEVARDVLPRLAGVACGGAVADLPMLTRLVVQHYGVNSGEFFWSLTPFMIAFAGIAAIPGAQPASGSAQSHLFVSVWLLASIYIGAFLLALALPLGTTCATLETGPVVSLAIALDVVLVVVFVLLWRRRRVRPPGA